MAALVLTDAGLAAAAGGPITDTEALALVHKHCLACHAAKPAHPAFAEPPNGVVLQTIADLRRYAQRIYAQTVQNKAMPLGNRTGMTEDERDALGRWLRGAP